MRKPFAAFLLLTYALTSTELGQLLKLPILVDHYRQHRQEEKELAFSDFLIGHYQASEPDLDYEQDMKLPFKKSADPESMESFHLFENNIEAALTAPLAMSSFIISLLNDKIMKGEPPTLLRPPC